MYIQNNNRMKISNKISDKERHYLNNLLVSGKGEIPDKEGNVSPQAYYKFVVEQGFIVDALKIIRTPKGPLTSKKG